MVALLNLDQSVQVRVLAGQLKYVVSVGGVGCPGTAEAVCRHCGNAWLGLLPRSGKSFRTRIKVRRLVCESLISPETIVTDFEKFKEMLQRAQIQYELRCSCCPDTPNLEVDEIAVRVEGGHGDYFSLLVFDADRSLKNIEAFPN